MIAAVDICLRATAFLVAVALIASQTLQNLEQLGWPTLYSGLGLAAVVVPVAMAMAVPAMGHNWNERRYLAAVVAFVVVLCGVGHTFVVALERVSNARDRLAAAQSSSSHVQDLARMALDRDLARVKELEAAESRPCARAQKDGSPTRECVAARAQTSLARERVGESQSKLAALGAPVEANGMARRYGTWADAIDTMHPLLLPLAVEVGGLVLIGFAFRRGTGGSSRPMPVALAPEPPAAKADPAPKLLVLDGVEERGDVIRRRRPAEGEQRAEAGVISTFKPPRVA